MLSSHVPSAAYRGGEVIAVSIRDLSTRGVGGQQQDPAALLLEKGPCAHFTGGWLCLWMGAENVACLQGFESRTVQVVASRCINYAIPLSKLPFVTRKYFSALRRVWLE
jgi:hypothetical protein